MRRHAGTLALFLALTSPGCVEESPAPAPPAPPPPAPPPPAAPPAPEDGSAWGCALDASESVLDLPALPTRVAASLSGETGWVLIEHGWQSLLALPVDGAGRPRGEARSVAIPAESLPVHATATAAGALLLLEGPCVVEDQSQRCLFALGLDAEGAPRGDVVRVPMAAPIHTLRRRDEGGVLWVARSHPAGAPQLDRFELGPSGVAHRGRSLGAVHDPGASTSEVLGLAVDGERWAVVWRFAAMEDPTSEVVLSTHAGESLLEPLHHALVIESFAFAGDALALVAGFEFSRAHLFRFGADGRVLARPELLAPGRPLPAPFTARASFHLVEDGRALSLRRVDGAGDRAGPDLLLHAHPGLPHAPATVTRDGERLLVFFVTSEDRTFRLARRALRCPSPPPSPAPTP